MSKGKPFSGNKKQSDRDTKWSFMFWWVDLKGELLVFMSAGISDPKQSHTGGLSKDFGGGDGFNRLKPILWTVLLVVHKNI